MTIKTSPYNILNTGNATTQKPVSDNPLNAVTGKSYFGPKAKRLQEEASYRGYVSNAWSTMKQWNSIKETIAKGEKGTLIIHMEKAPDGTEQQKRSFLFNRCQLESFKALDEGDKAF